MDEKRAEALKNEINGYIVTRGYNMSSFARLFSEKYGRKLNGNNLSDKLTRGTIKYLDMLDIAEILGYRIKWERID